MTLGYVVVCVLVGVGTYLFRYLPTRLGVRAGEGRAMRGPLGAFLADVGVAAVAALLAAALEPVVATAWRAGDWRSALAAAVGLGVTAAVFRWRRGVAVATLIGALAYGLAVWLLGVG